MSIFDQLFGRKMSPPTQITPTTSSVKVQKDPSEIALLGESKPVEKPKVNAEKEVIGKDPKKQKRPSYFINEEIESYVPMIKAEEGRLILEAEHLFEDEVCYEPDGTVRPKLAIGYSHTSCDIKPGQKITKDEAEKLLREDIAEKVRIAKSPNHFGSKFNDFDLPMRQMAIQSYYRGGLSDSPKTRGLILSGDFEGASKEFLKHTGYQRAKQEGSGQRGVAIRMEKFSDFLKNYKK
jgi:hypothetical protein